MTTTADTRTMQRRTVQTHCPYCALQCAMNLTVTERPGEPDTFAVEGASFPTNKGRLCRKGSTAAELLTRRHDRLTSPLLRGEDGELHPASWDEALEHVATEIRRIQGERGADAVGVFGSGGLTNEKTYALGKFARVALGTAQIDYNGRFCMSSASKASTLAFGLDRGLPFPLTDLDSACTVLLLGSNVADTMPPFVQHLEGARATGGLIVVDPRRSNTAELTAEGGGLHIAPAPGGDLVLLLSVAQVVLEEGLADADYLQQRVSGLDSFRRSVTQWWPERAQSLTGVGADQIRLIARRLGHAARAARNGGDPVYILTGRGVEQHKDGTDTARAAISLALLLGLPGTRAGGYGTLTGQGNGQGGREMGQKTDQLPGIRSITDPADRAHMARIWGVEPEALPGPGRPAAQLLHTMGHDDGVRALLVHGSNVAVSAPDAARVVENLRALELLVVADFFLSETAAEADVVLPVLQWAEEDGTMTNLEGRVLRRRKLVEPPSGAPSSAGSGTDAPDSGPRSELWIWHELARRLGCSSAFPVEPAEVFAEIRQATEGAAADYSGLDWQLLDDGHAAYWPVPSALLGGESSLTGEPIIGTSRMFLERFAHADGRARLAAITPGRTPAPAPGELTLTTGRHMEHYQSGTQTRRVAALLDAHPEATIAVHPATALEHGLEEGTDAVVANAQGEMTARVVWDAGIRTDTIFAPFHYAGQGTANLLTRALTDPQSGMPEFKNTPVTIRPAGAPGAARSETTSSKETTP
ncbi:molybdopterin oxidoreductase family protein [Nesterenkonia sp. HG001]|uniref:molybdopterin oxidoreductase family protein n=1 Tax=Nesterenkonia sp. HG001 TaxID=2983207 RepID=UPI002AC4C2D0|nr:molybdopterin oxidoreductase family protein [Nesterenkonia sp. HG001]MDZ5077592.1 molybdopterin oxidoreductase family protein [Nesterenkonia sp. HG001]